MDRKQIAEKLRSILDRADIESDGMVNRKKSSKHEDEIEVLLEHLSLLVSDLKFETEASGRELIEIRNVLEEGG